jgi:hypothetical protein
MPVILRLTALLLGGRMRVVEAHQPLAVRPVQRERIVEPVRLLPRFRHARNHQPNPVTALRIDDKHLAIEIEQGIESWGGRLRHARRLSFQDNHHKACGCEALRHRTAGGDQAGELAAFQAAAGIVGEPDRRRGRVTGDETAGHPSIGRGHRLGSEPLDERYRKTKRHHALPTEEA